MNTALWMVAVLAAVLPVQEGGGHETAARPAGIWAGVDIGERPVRIPPVTLSDSQEEAVRRVIHAHAKLDGLEECDQDEPNGEWLGKIQFQGLPVTAAKQVILAESGMGCARGGQGANGAMWIVELGGGKPVLLASPKEGFDGWLYAVLPTASHGYNDVVLGWHWSAYETGLRYFRFDGRSYRCIGSARMSDDRDTGKRSFDSSPSCVASI